MCVFLQRNSAGGPWIPIASELPNSGQYAWQLKANLPQRAYLRLEVRDAAGNLGTYETPDPAALDLFLARGAGAAICVHWVGSTRGRASRRILR